MPKWSVKHLGFEQRLADYLFFLHARREQYCFPFDPVEKRVTSDEVFLVLNSACP